MQTITLREMTIQFEPDYEARDAILHHVWIEDEETDSQVDVLPKIKGAHEAALAREVFRRHWLSEMDR